jgi:hypothetical protein
VGRDVVAWAAPLGPPFPLSLFFCVLGVTVLDAPREHRCNGRRVVSGCFHRRVSIPPPPPAALLFPPFLRNTQKKVGVKDDEKRAMAREQKKRKKKTALKNQMEIMGENL